jgi:hypothetical protein
VPWVEPYCVRCRLLLLTYEELRLARILAQHQGRGDLGCNAFVAKRAG